MPLFLQVLKEESNYNAVDNHIGMLGPIILISLFIIERILTWIEKRRERKLNWYTSVVVQPNLRIINNYFTDYAGEIVQISTNKAKYLQFPTTQQTLLKAKEFSGLFSLSKEFEFEFIILVLQYDISLYNKLLYDIINELNDKVIAALDYDKLTKDQLEELLERVKTYKSIFYDALYSVMKK